jgi:hypothetical protein
LASDVSEIVTVKAEHGIHFKDTTLVARTAGFMVRADKESSHVGCASVTSSEIRIQLEPFVVPATNAVTHLKELKNEQEFR